MDARDFVYWLQGYFEVNGVDDNAQQSLTPKQVAVIKEHIAKVLVHVPSPTTPPPHKTFVPRDRNEYPVDPFKRTRAQLRDTLIC